MRYLPLVLVATMVPAVAETCDNARPIQYEPSVVEVSGKVNFARARHPNGTTMKYPIMKLATPVSVNADGLNPINSDEPCVSELQLIAQDPALRKKLYAARGKSIVARGTVFHEHTAWHMRKLVVMVTEVKNAP